MQMTQLTDVEILGALRAYVKSSLLGQGAIQGDDGFSPTVVVKTNTDSEYVLTITDKNGSYDTPNLKGSDISLLADEFSTAENYTKGDVVAYNGVLYQFDTNHSAGAWNSAEVTQKNVVDLIAEVRTSGARYNVLDYGLKGDKTTDNTSALRNLISLIPNGSVIFFPVGTYMISEGIEINKDVTFFGENQEMQSAGTASNRIHDPMSIIKYGGNTANVTMFTKASGYYDVNFVNLTLDGGNSYDVTDNWAGEFKTLPFYNQLEAENLREINGLDVSILSPGIVKNCMFWGFSGYGLKVAQHKYVERCGFYKCKKGIVTTFSDNLLHDLWFCKSGTAIYMLPKENDYFASINLSDIWADQLIDHLVEADSSVTSAQIITDNIWVDSVGKSAFYLPEATISKAHIQGTFGRIGMDYAGIADADRTSALAKNTDFMACGRLRYSTLNLNISNETIGKGSNAKGECFSRLITTYKTSNNNDYNKIICNSFPVARLYDSNTQPQYSYFADTEYNGTDGKISIYGNAAFVDGFYTYSLSPIGRIKAPSKDFLVYDRLAKKLYRSTAADNNTAWAEVKIDGDVTIVTTLPTASASEEGKMYLYIGETVLEQNLMQGATYKCMQVSGAYQWVIVSVTLEMIQAVLSSSATFDEFKTNILGLYNTVAG